VLVSDVGSGAVLTLVVPLALLMVILAIWGIRYRSALRRRRPPRGGATTTGAETPPS